jgi:tetratricopeptide (TPR) repeat protein
MNIGLVLVTTGDVLHAERSLRSALEQFSAADVLDPTLEPALHLNLGWALALADRTAEALAEIDRGRGLIESTKGHDHSHYVRSFAMEIVVLRRAGERERLLAVAERAVALAENTDIDVNLAALLKFELAQALRQMGRQPARARELATEALRTFEAGGAPLTHQAADVRAWLRK